MYIASVSSTIKFHEFPNGIIVHNYQPGKAEGPIRSISWSRDGNWLLVVPFSGQTEIVSTKDQLKLLKTIHDVEEPTYACFQNTTKRNVAIGTKTGSLLIYDIKSRNVKKRFPRASSEVTQIAFTSKDAFCIAGCKNGDVFVFNNVTNGPPANLRVPKSNSITCLKTNNLKRNLVLGGSNEGNIVVWDININRSKFFAEAHKGSSVNSLAFSPVNSDLVLSAGNDRQFCFYDIADSKCIASIPVENCITAVDFSPDGSYFVTASQNGHVYVYDSRNIQSPIHSFLCHKTTIRHVAFQNTQESSNVSVYSSSSNSIRYSGSPADFVTRRASRTSEIFGMYVPSIESPINDKTSAVSVEGGDSFLAALGLDKNNTANDSVFINENNRLPIVIEPEPSESTSFCNKNDAVENDNKPKFSSTPKCNFITKGDGTNIIPYGISPEEIKSQIKECFSEELKSVVNDLKNDIKYQTTHIIHQTRLMILDMQMGNVKEFINLENFITRISEEGPNVKYDRLLEENENLRKQNNFLEEQLKNLMSKPEEME